MRSSAPATGSPSTATPLAASTSRAGSVTTSPPTVTRPLLTSASARRREAMPAWARYLASRMRCDDIPVDLELLEETLAERGEPAFRARQVWAWAARGAGGYEEMTDLSLDLRGVLAERVLFSTLRVEREAEASDGTVKTLFSTADGRPVEAVLMRYRDGRRSVCVSSQSGCPLTCTFCATGTMRFGRNLSASEILDQVLHFRRLDAVNHLVFMGM